MPIRLFKRRQGAGFGFLFSLILPLFLALVTGGCGEVQNLLGEEDPAAIATTEQTQTVNTDTNDPPIQPPAEDPPPPDDPPAEDPPALTGNGMLIYRSDYSAAPYQTCWYIENTDTGRKWHPVNMPTRSESFDYLSDYTLVGFTYVPAEGTTGCPDGEHIELTDLWDETPPPPVYHVVGQIRFIEVEGGCWNLERYYVPDLPREFQVDGMWVEVSFSFSLHQISICMTGPLIDLIEIKPYEPGTGLPTTEPVPPPPGFYGY